jgi:hypothetical protein
MMRGIRGKTYCFKHVRRMNKKNKGGRNRNPLDFSFVSQRTGERKKKVSMDFFPRERVLIHFVL